MKQAMGAEGNVSKKRVVGSPPDSSIGRARKLCVAENRRVIIRKERLNTAPTSTSQRNRMPSPEKTGNVPPDPAETNWMIVRKQKRKGKSKKENPVPTRGKKAETVLIKASGDNKMSYADMLKELKTNPCPDEVGSKVGKIRKSRDRKLLIELVTWRKFPPYCRATESEFI